MQKRKGARLGQHFLKHGWAAAKLAHAVPLREGEVFLEIGPGKGVLTKELLKLGHVVAVEKDPLLVGKLHTMFADELRAGRLTLVEQDIRDFNTESWQLKAESYIVAANIPYYITGEIIRQFLTADKQPRAMALLVQKEVAQRIVGREQRTENGTKESILSLSVKAYGTPRIIARVGASHFSPPPSVDSAILVIENISKRFFDSISEEKFFALVHAGFASKRKQLKGNLKKYFGLGVGDVLRSCGIFETARAETVSLKQWAMLTKQLMTI